MSYVLAQASAHRLPLRDRTIQTCVTSPPYWGLRNYAGEQTFVWGGEDHAHEWTAHAATEGYADESRRRWQHGATRAQEPQQWQVGVPQGATCPCGAWNGALGLEPSPALYVQHMVEVFREVRRVLRNDGTLWLNLGDSYSSGDRGSYDQSAAKHRPMSNVGGRPATPPGLKAKDLVGIPWRVAFALQADGWYLRSDIVWAKPNPMPSSVSDRPTKSHEYVFLLSKSKRYLYDAEAIREEGTSGPSDLKKMREQLPRIGGKSLSNEDPLNAANAGTHIGQTRGVGEPDGARNARTVWTIATQPYPGAHFATFPEALPERCILAGSSKQACGVCGAPWTRATERVDLGWDGSKYGERAVEATGGAISGGTAHSTLGSSNGTRTGQRATLGWQPGCTHEDGSGRSVVLDPFNGSGTTGRVALRHGRSYVGLDLSLPYLREQALHRVDPLAAAAQAARTGSGAQQVMSL